MADREDTPGSGSPLSDIDSDAFTEDLKFNRSRSHSDASTISDAPSDASATPSTSTPRHSDMPPAKKRRTGAYSYDRATPQLTMGQPRSPTGSISSDSSGSVPTYSSFANLGPTHPLSTAYAAAQAHPDNPDKGDYIQVTRCEWTGCPDPEQGNMDNLVAHINEVHIPPRQKKYFCEWEGCSRKSLPHTSAYALKAHMRSHTREKPFTCALPECDRSFTRSDALAKHMRTVHETEALRPSDPVPRGHTGGISTGAQGNSNGPSFKRIKLRLPGQSPGHSQLILTDLPPLPTRASPAYHDKQAATKQSHELQDRDLQDAVDLDQAQFQLPIQSSYYPKEVYENMDEYEKNLPPSQWFRVLRRQLKWAQQESDLLAKELSEARSTTDDVQGHAIRKTAPSSATTKENERIPLDERIGDDIRREEWSVTETLLDQLLRAEVLSYIASDSDSTQTQTQARQVNGNSNGTKRKSNGKAVNGNKDEDEDDEDEDEDDGDEEADDDQPQQPQSKGKKERITEKKPSVTIDINTAINETDPWNLLRVSRGTDNAPSSPLALPSADVGVGVGAGAEGASTSEPQAILST